MAIEHFYTFIDTNLLYDEKLDHNVFNTQSMNELLKIRNNYNEIFGDSKKIHLHIPEIVIKEVISLKHESSKREFKKIETSVRYLERTVIKEELLDIKKNFKEKITTNGDSFLLENEIIEVPCCSNNYFENIVQKAVDKKIPFKPKYDAKKNRETGDNGFKDTVIWYSIIEYIKKQEIQNNDQVIFLTNNTFRL